MKNHSMHIAGATGPRVDGIDVALLLRDLGEANAASGAVELFSLCLNAQRVLSQIILSDTNIAVSRRVLPDPIGANGKKGEPYAL
jgi:hypothetical protein